MKACYKNRLISGLCVLFLSSLISIQIRAQPMFADNSSLSESSIWVVSYIEVNTESIDPVAGLLTKHAKANGGVDGNLWSQEVQRIGRKNHFALIQVWSDQAAFNAYSSLSSTVQFHLQLEPYLYSPYDRRIHLGLNLDPKGFSSWSDESVFVLTHADIIRNEQFSPCSLGLPSGSSDAPCGNQLLINHAQESRAHKGNLRFDILTQNSRTNHMTVLEVWSNADAQQEHLSHNQTIFFHYALSDLSKMKQGNNPMATILANSSMLGSLWDERLYFPF